MRTFILTAAILAAISSSPAIGQQADAEPVERVRIADLDLGTEDGRRQLARRVGRATEYACGSYAGVREHADIERIDQCRRRAMIKVEQQVAAITKDQRARSASR